MAIVNEQSVLDFYLKEIEEDTISFLEGKEDFKESIKELFKIYANRKTKYFRFVSF